jgi:hypothetical protein
MQPIGRPLITGVVGLSNKPGSSPQESGPRGNVGHSVPGGHAVLPVEAQTNVTGYVFSESHASVG